MGRSAIKWTMCCALLAALSLAAEGEAKMAAAPTMRTFAGTWSGHTRGLTITRTGIAKESIGDGCCDPIVDIWFHLSPPRGTTAHASVSATITRIVLHDPSFTGTIHRRPRVGDIAIFRLDGGVLTETLTGTNYCNLKAGATGICGA
jgi:hypothetical protein